MHPLIKLALATALLAITLGAALHPTHGPIPGNPLAIVGLLLVGVGLMRHARETAH